MHPRRHYGILIGGLLLFFVLIWRYFISPALLSIPSDFTYSTDIASIDNFYDPLSQSYNGPKYTVSENRYEVVEKDKNGLVIKNQFDVSTTEGVPIISIERLYGIDPKTSEQVLGLGDKNRTGYLFAPHNLKKGAHFTYWHANYDAPAEMNYVDEQVLYGLNVYHYETFYEGEKIDQTDNLGDLPGVPEEKGIILKPHLELWVEPLTGLLIKYSDDTIAYYYDIETGEILYPWNHFSNTVTDEGVKQHVTTAQEEKIKYLIVQWGIPSLFTLLGVCLLFFAIGHKKKILQNSRSKIDLALIIFVLVIPLTGIFSTWYVLKESILKGTNDHFDERVKGVEDAISSRLNLYSVALEGARGLFAASDDVTRTEWSTYVNELNLTINYPGVQGVGYVPVISPEEKPALEEEVRLEGYPNFKIFPDEGQSPYTTILYLEPLIDRNLRAFGYDMSTDPIRKKAMDQARNTGETTLSGRVTLLQETDVDIQSGFLMYVPLYKSGYPLDTVADREKALYAFVYSPFRAGDFFGNLFAEKNLGIYFEMFDGTLVSEENLMFKYDLEGEPQEGNRLNKADTLYIDGHPWTFQFQGLEEFDLNATQKNLLSLFLIVSLVVQALFIFIFYALITSREKALEYIEKH